MGKTTLHSPSLVFAAAVLAALVFSKSVSAQTVTESPYTVEPGHAWIEFVAGDYTRDRAEGLEYETWALFDALFIVGVFDNLDLQLRLTPYVKERFDVDAGITEEAEGFGDVQVRSAFNLWGNEDGVTALTLIPYMQFPSGTDVSSEKTEGGLIGVLALAPAESWWLVLQGEIDRLYDVEDERYDNMYLHTAVLAVDIFEAVGFYTEYVGVFDSTAAADYVSTGGGGLRVMPTDTVTLYGGAQFGLSEDADDVRLFAGFIIQL